MLLKTVLDNPAGRQPRSLAEKAVEMIESDRAQEIEPRSMGEALGDLSRSIEQETPGIRH